MNNTPEECTFLTNIKSTVENFNMLSKGDSVIIGLSGGADSVALTYALFELKEQLKINLEAVHINHNIRGEEAKRDELFVMDFCKKLNIPLTVVSADIPKIAETRKISEEQAGREVRYTEFNKQIGGRNNCKIATAHTLSDLMETMLFNMARGTGVKGLRGITPVRDNIIRPLIEVTRSDVENYCQSRGLDFVTDSTNLSDDYTRNKIRHRVIPCLYEINPSLNSSMYRLSCLAEQDDGYITEVAEDYVKKSKIGEGYDISKLSPLHPAVLSRAVHIICDNKPDYKQTALISKIIKDKQGAVNITGEYRATIRNNLLYYEKIIHVVNDEMWSIPVTGEKTVLPDGRILKITSFNKNYGSLFLKVNKLLLNNAIIYDTLFCNPIARNRKAGDLFCEAGRTGTKTLKKLFNEKKFPLSSEAKGSF